MSLRRHFGGADPLCDGGSLTTKGSRTAAFVVCWIFFQEQFPFALFFQNYRFECPEDCE